MPPAAASVAAYVDPTVPFGSVVVVTDIVDAEPDVTELTDVPDDCVVVVVAPVLLVTCDCAVAAESDEVLPPQPARMSEMRRGNPRPNVQRFFRDVRFSPDTGIPSGNMRVAATLAERQQIYVA